MNIKMYQLFQSWLPHEFDVASYYRDFKIGDGTETNSSFGEINMAATKILNRKHSSWMDHGAMDMSDLTFDHFK